MLKEAKKHIRLRTRIDIIIIAIVAVSSFMISIQFDLSEAIYHFSRKYEYIELDELLPSLFIVSITFGYFSFRRWLDVRFLSHLLEELVLTCPITHIANRRALQRLLEQVNKEQTPQHSFILVSVLGIEEVRKKYGSVTTEQVLIEVLYLLSKELTDEQLIISLQIGQFIIHAPNLNFMNAHTLAQRLKEIHVSARHQCIRELKITSASYSISDTITEEDLLERLEDNLSM
ncbi:diguanylate cyclase domain-containing protein [Pseudoalteromonas phenolica]|uniref:diguanylate cyclase domain-containing protein n=1 Tax=Pseudoalteromonas phenolica TaxID=161398 RepID=UPI00110ADFF1|nr:diguanylate cyclase [Pseudoalteromonas phenolica]